MTLSDVIEKHYKTHPGIIWEFALFEVAKADILFDLNIYGQEGWEPIRPFTEGSRHSRKWLFKRQFNKEN